MPLVMQHARGQHLPSATLKALSGIARKFEDHRTGLYLAGPWRGCITSMATLMGPRAIRSTISHFKRVLQRSSSEETSIFTKSRDTRSLRPTLYLFDICTSERFAPEWQKSLCTKGRAAKCDTCRAGQNIYGAKPVPLSEVRLAASSGCQNCELMLYGVRSVTRAFQHSPSDDLVIVSFY
jgi:hypothetical protein